MNKIIATEYLPGKDLIHTQLRGVVSLQDVIYWEKTLHESLSKIPDNGRFKIFVNIHGFQADNFDTHKAYRTIIPLTLADYGWKVGYVNMFEEEAKKLRLTNKRGIQCFGAAHAYQDETKISKYEREFSSSHERFFTDPAEAEKWIISLT